MLTDTDLLAALSQRLSPGEIPDILARLLRVPETWQRLHDQGFLDRAISCSSAGSLTPCRLGLLSLGLDDMPGGERMTEDLEHRLSTAWAAALRGASDGTLETTSLLAIGLTRVAAEDGPAKTAAQILSSPQIWRSPLACAWDHFPQSHLLLRELVGAAGEGGLRIVTNAMLANLSCPQAAHMLYASCPDLDLGKLSQALGPVEPRLLAELANVVPSAANKNPGGKPANTAAQLLQDAARHQLAGSLDGARAALEAAWEEAMASAAAVADQLAEMATLDNDPVVQLQARQEALRTSPTAARRAQVAASLIDLGRPQEALSTLSPDGRCPEEHIAAGLAALQLGAPSEAAKSLYEAVESTPSMTSVARPWVYRLAHGLQAVGLPDLAVRTIQAAVDRNPADASIRTEYARFLSQGGDHSQAATQAALAHGLAPDSSDARRILAQSLQDDGRPKEALPHWQALVSQDAALLPTLALCALQANDLAPAEQAAASILAKDPDSTSGHVLMGRILAATGAFEAARDHLERATRQAAEDPEAWIALAECQTRAGDAQAAGATLATAAQRTPHNARLLASLASWLRKQGRSSEALEALGKAVRLEPTEPQWMIEQGELLLFLGHHAEALRVLRPAVASKPGSFQARMALARTYEELGEFAAAGRQLPAVPDASPADLHLAAGRIAVRSAIQTKDLVSLDQAARHLTQARTANPSDPEPLYWLGRLYDLKGDPSEAFSFFRACQDRIPRDDREFQQRAVLGLAKAAQASGQIPLAVTSLEEARDRYPTSLPVLIALSQAYTAAELPEMAIRAAEYAAQLDPMSHEALQNLAFAADKIQDWPTAIHTLSRLADLRPHDPEAWLFLADVSHRAGETSRARSAVAHVLLSHRHQPLVLHQAGALLQKMGLPAAAQSALKRAFRLQPDNPALLRDLAKASEIVADYEAAQQAWGRCAGLEPGNVEPLFRAAKALWNLGRREVAIGLWQRTISLEPGNAALHTELARAYLANGEVPQGLNHYALARQISPEDPDLGLEAGQAGIRAGAFREAQETLEHTLHLAPYRSETLTALAECYLDLRHPKQAKEALARAAGITDLSTRGQALAAIASIMTGDLAGAQSALQAALGRAPHSADDAILLSRAALQLGSWEVAADVLVHTIQGAASAEMPDLTLALARTQVRRLEAKALYAAAGALAHAPRVEGKPELILGEIDGVLSRATALGVPEPEIHLLRLRARAALGLVAFEDFRSQAAKAVADPTRELDESLALAALVQARPQDALDILGGAEPGAWASEWSEILRGLSLAALERHDAACQSCRAASHSASLRPIADFHLGRSLLALEQPTEGVASMNAALAAWPAEPDWHFDLGSRYLRDGNLAAALPHLQQAAELDPGNTQHGLALARALRDDGQLSEAKTAYEQVTATLPRSGEVWKEAAQLALAVGDAAEAEMWFERACTLMPSDAHCVIGSALAALALGKSREATEFARSAARLAPEDTDVLLGVGEILSRQGKLEKALQTYDRALGRTPGALPIRLARSRLMCRMGHPQKAAEELRLLLEAEPESDLAWAAMAEAKEAAGDTQSALEAARQAARFSPRCASHRLVLARLCRKVGQLDLALDEIKQALSFGAGEAGLLIELGRIHEERRELDHALDAYEQAIGLNQSSAEAHFRAGLVLKNLKAYARAGRMLKRAVDLNPKDPEAFHQLAAVHALELVHGGLTRTAVTT